MKYTYPAGEEEMLPVFMAEVCKFTLASMVNLLPQSGLNSPVHMPPRREVEVPEQHRAAYLPA